MPGTMHLGVLSIGRTERELIDEVIDKLSSFFTFDVVYAGAIDLPTSSFNPDRKQYFSPAILKTCRYEALKLGFEKILGITPADIYTSRASYIFGQAEFSGKVALVSYFRLKDHDPVVIAERLIKESIHEIGHTFGLRHCRNAECVMYFSKSVSDTDRKDSSFCKRCRGRLDGHIR